MKKWQKELIKNINNVRGEYEYLQDFAVFDLESTTVTIKNVKEAILYSWQFYFAGQYITGRTAASYREFIKFIKAELKENKLMVFVHNLAYDGKFIASICGLSDDKISAKYTKNNDPWASDIWYSLVDENIQYRCSYCLTDKSLAELTKCLEYEKVSGFDYNKKRFPWSELTEDETKYIAYDVIGLYDALHNYLSALGIKTITNKIPRTVHSLVRREFASAYRNSRKVREINLDDLDNLDLYADKVQQPSVLQLTLSQYEFASESVQGGYFYASRRWTNKLIKNVIDPDGRSEYPAVLLTEKFPTGRWKWEKELTIKHLQDLVNKDYGWIAELTFNNFRLKDLDFGFPYARALDKCERKFAGRCISAKTYTCTITNIDYAIIKNIYDFDDVNVNKCMSSKLDYLPKWFTNLLLKYFELKETAPKNSSARLRAKIVLNAITGAMAMNFYRYYDGSQKAYAAYCAKNNWFNYAWYIFMTAYARQNIFEVILIDEPNVIYAAADSVKVKSNYKLDKFNKKVIKKCNNRNSFIIVNNKKVYPGVWIPEHKFVKFVTIGKSRYCGELDEPIKLEDTKTIECAKNDYGFTAKDFETFNIVCATSGGDPLKIAFDVFKNGGIETFKVGKDFNLTHNVHYVNKLAEPIELITREGYKFELTSNVVIETVPVTYTLKPDLEVEED